MTIWRAVLTMGRGFVLCTMIGGFLLAGTGLASNARAQSSDTTSLEQIKTQLEDIEEALGRELLESEIEAVTTVADVEKLLSSG